MEKEPTHIYLIDYDSSLLKLTKKVGRRFCKYRSEHLVNSQGCLEGSKTTFGIVFNISEAKQFVRSDHVRTR